MECPVSGAEVNGRAVEAFRFSALAIPESGRFYQDFRTLKPLLQERRRDVEKNAFAELLDCGQPLDFNVSREVSAIHGKLNFIKLALSAEVGGGSSRVKPYRHVTSRTLCTFTTFFRKPDQGSLRPRPSRDKVSA